MGSVLRLVEHCQRFFEASATQEILDEFLPKFTTHSISGAILAQGYIVLFLPVVVPKHSITHKPLSNAAMTPKAYIPTIFSMWSIFTCSTTYDAQFTDLISRIAEHNTDTTDCQDIGLFTKQQIKTIFTVCLRMMNLPVGSRDGSLGGGGAGGGTTGYGNNGLKVDIRAGNSLFLRRKPEKFKSLARLMVYTMFPEKQNGTETSFTLSCLGELIQAIELYYHPSNHGSWSYPLAVFACHLSSEFLKRWKQEREDDCNTPVERRLTPALRREFVLILRPVIYLSMFGKDHYTVGASQSTLTYLSWLEPTLIFPGLLERIYPSLETLTETHRTASALSILADIALPMLSRDHYPAGGKHLLPLLHLATPGIDMNDPMKAMGALMFIATAVMSVPIRDLTDGNTYYNPAVDGESNYDGMDIDGEDQEKELPREVEDQLCKATTAQFEEWLAKFLRRVFTIFDNLPQHDRKKQGGAMEAGVTQMLLHACDVVFGQLSDDLYDLALRMVVEFVNDQVIPNAVRTTGLLCDSITSANVKKAAKHFIPLCIANIRTELDYGASSTITNSASSNPIQSDSTLHWNQNILFSVVSMMGPEILNYKTEIIDIGLEMVSKCRSRRGVMWTGKFLRNVLKGLLETYPKDFRNLKPEEWNDKDLMANSHLLWGKPGDPKDLAIDWHTPSEDEKNFALEFLDVFLTPSLKRLEDLISNDPSVVKPTSTHELTNEFCRHLAVVRNCVMGSSTMVKDDGIDEESKPETNDARYSLIYSRFTGSNSKSCSIEEIVNLKAAQRLVAGYAFTGTDPRTEKARSIRKNIGELLHKIALYFKAHREDDVESIKIVIKITRAFLTERGVEKALYERSKNGYNYAKGLGKTPLSHKRYPRNLLVRRAYNHHLLRLRQNFQGRVRTEFHDNLLQDILDLSLSSYAEIRKMSQNALSASARYFLGAKYMIMPTILEALEQKNDSNRMKGSLYLLTHKSLLMICLRDWKFISMFVLAICRAQHEDKPSIQELIRKVFVDYVSHYNTFSFRAIVSTNINVPLEKLYPFDISSQKTKALESRVTERKQNQIQSYHELMQSLLAVMKDKKVHWRYATMAANFLELFLRPEMAPTAGLAEFANKCTLSELPPLRRIGVGATTQLLLYIKQRTFAKGDQDLLITKSTRNPLKHIISVDGNDLHMSQKLLEASCQNVDLKNANILVDRTTTGWYVWPKTYEAYEVCTDETPPVVDPESQEAYDELKTAFLSADYWVKMSGYISQETSRNQEDVFSMSHARLFCSIFQSFQDGPLAACKDIIEELCNASDQKNHQRAAAELLGGLVRGMKHWPISKSLETWKWLVPLIQKTFSSITPDSLTYWESFVRCCASDHDPRRIRPLIDLVLKAEFDPTSDAAFSESRKLLLVRTLMTSLKWRMLPFSDNILETYLCNLQHPYKQVREVIGGNINEIMQIQWVPGLPSVEALMASNARDGQDGVGNVPFSLAEQGQENHIKDVIRHLDHWLEEAEKSSTLGSSDYTNASKTVLCWLHEAVKHWRVAGTLPYVLPFMPRLFKMQEMNDDQDLQQMATRVLHLMAQLSYPPSMVPQLIQEFIDILKTSSSWHIRIRALPVLQIFFFKHLFVMDGDQILRIMEIISAMLLDPQIEVRQMAAVTLGGLVRCSQRDAIDSLRKRFSSQLDTRLPKRRRHPTTGKVIEPAGFAEAMLKKHAGVLGLSCLVNAFPYEVPKWMPLVLCELAGCMSDPAEIQSTVRKTFSDFRRTHSDAWHEDMNKFTEDQLSMLSDMLISPSYYA
ncbi:hypothetical protein CLU79DRAFT_851017 [Phycomyces nitens]|nr:hypothetical protein CLU79DRAFT_851017 [Phycomyces nitens]